MRRGTLRRRQGANLVCIRFSPSLRKISVGSCKFDSALGFHYICTPKYDENETLVICYPRCSTCQKALKWLQERGIEVEVRDIVQQNPSEAELEEWIDRSGLAVNRFFNTSGLRYKALNLKEKVRTAPREELIRVLSTDGMLVKRPLLIASDKILVGFREPEWAAALSEKR